MIGAIGLQEGVIGLQEKARFLVSRGMCYYR